MIKAINRGILKNSLKEILTLLLALSLSACVAPPHREAVEELSDDTLRPSNRIEPQEAEVIALGDEEALAVVDGGQTIDNNQPLLQAEENFLPRGLQASDSTENQYIASPEELLQGRKTATDVEQLLALGLQPTIYFAFNQSQLNEQSKAVLLAYVTVLTKPSTLSNDVAIGLELEGHTDYVGTSQYNLSLGFRRALSVRDFLFEQGVSTDRLTVQSYGEERLVFEQSGNDYQRYNRRVEIYFK